MGLDMYLSAAKYAGQHYDPHGLFGRLRATTKDWPVEPESFSIKATVVYWRKANAIHQWFVNNCQEGRDECQESYVALEQLKELRDLCRDLLATRSESQALENLPPQSGFFFGGTEIDEWYWNDLEHTAEALTKLIDHPEADKLEYAYRSSW